MSPNASSHSFTLLLFQAIILVMRKAISMGLAPFIFFACASNTGVHADLKKLRPWSQDLEASQPLPPPYVADFEAGPRSLTFLSLERSNEQNSPSLELLGRAMDSRSYSVVVLEGVTRSLGMSPSSLREEAVKDGKGGLFRNGETSVAVVKANARKIPFVGAEPDEELIKSAIRNAGYDLIDLFGFYVVRQIPHWKRDGTLTRETFEEAYSEARLQMGKRLGILEKDIPTREAFEQWYLTHNGQPFRVGAIRPDTTSPFPGGKLFTQKIAAVTDRVRSEHILRVTEEMLNKFGKVLLVFNAAHFPVQQLALESMLGKPVRISDQP